MGGVTFSYTELTGDNYKLLILDDVNGVRLNYNRTYADIGSINLDLGDDLTFDISDYKYLEHEYTAAGFLRTYMGLGNSKVFGFFNELRLTYGYGQGKTLSGSDEKATGTYQTSHRLRTIWQSRCRLMLSVWILNGLNRQPIR